MKYFFLLLPLFFCGCLFAEDSLDSHLELAYVETKIEAMLLLKLEADGHIDGLATKLGNKEDSEDSIVRHAFVLWLFYEGPWKQGKLDKGRERVAENIKICKQTIVDAKNFDDPFGFLSEDWNTGKAMAGFFVNKEDWKWTPEGKVQYREMIAEFQSWVKK